MTTRRWLACAPLLLALVGCGLGPSGGMPPTVASPRPAVGYALPNAWQAQVAGLARALCASRVGLTEIEWHDPAGATSPQAAGRLLADLRACGITLVVSLTNWNNAHVRGWPDSRFLAELDALLALGTDGVWLAPVSEPSAEAKPQRWISLAWAKWPGTFVLPDGFPQPAVPADWRDRHLCSLAQLEYQLGQPAPRVLFNTDCTPVGNPGVAEAGKLVTIALGADNTLMVYDWQGSAVDQQALDVMSQAVADW